MLGHFGYVRAIGWLMNEPKVVSIEFGWPGLSYRRSFSKVQNRHMVFCPIIRNLQLFVSIDELLLDR
jgi:hypothetical protein